MNKEILFKIFEFIFLILSAVLLYAFSMLPHNAIQTGIVYRNF